MKKVGLIVNPVAGMEGAVGLKGTDEDGEMYKKSRGLGIEPKTPKWNRDCYYLSFKTRNTTRTSYVGGNCA